MSNFSKLVLASLSCLFLTLVLSHYSTEIRVQEKLMEYNIHGKTEADGKTFIKLPDGGSMTWELKPIKEDTIKVK